MSKTTSPSPGADPPTWSKSWVRDYFEAICIAVVFALFVRTFVVQAFKIPSSSMEQNLLVGDHLLVDKFVFAPHAPWMETFLPYRDIERGDVLVFKYPRDVSRDFIKRVIGLGGDEIRIVGETVFRNGEPLEEHQIFFDPRRRPDLEIHQPPQVREKHLFMMGDNRRNSEDSRRWGTVPESYVKGKALLIYWSFEVPEELKHVEARGDATARERGHSLGYTLLHFFDKTRWSRTFRRIH